MATTVILPKQGQSVETCIITEWYKKKGDNVAVGDILFSYETDKASFEEEAAVDGILLDVFYDDGDEVPVGAAARIEQIAEEQPAAVVERMADRRHHGPGDACDLHTATSSTIPTMA